MKSCLYSRSDWQRIPSKGGAKAGMHTLAVPTLRRRRQEGQFKVILSCTATLTSVSAAGDPVSTTKTKQRFKYVIDQNSRQLGSIFQMSKGAGGLSFG